MAADGFFKHALQFFLRIRQRTPRLWLQLRLKISADFILSLAVKQHTARRKAVDSLKKSFLQHGILKRKILLQRPFIQLFRDARELQDALNLRRKHEIPIHHCVKQRLDSEKIPRQHQFFFFLIPDSKGKHSTKLLHKRRTISLKTIHQRLRVRASDKKNLLFPFHLLPQFLVIIDFSVKHHCQVLTDAFHRLQAAFQVDDTQAAKSKGHAVIYKTALRIWTSMYQLFLHFFHNLSFVLFLSEKSTNSAHAFLHLV